MMMSRDVSKAVFAALVAAAFLLAVPGRAVSSPSTRPVSEITKWFDDLSDADPVHRSDARIHLMGLKLEDLPMLSEIVERRTSIEPSAGEMLHEIVTQIYLASQDYEPNKEGKGWMGIGISQPLLVESDSDETSVRGIGMVINSRIPGFCAYRSLMDGDVIIRIREMPNTTMLTSLDLMRTVGAFHPGDLLHLDIMRGGETMVVPVTLDPRPEQVDSSNPEFYAGRATLMADAEAYYAKHFASLIDPNAENPSAD